MPFSVAIFAEKVPASLNIVIKVDWQDFSNAAGTGVDRFNLGLGWLF
jgi:hypothetical protein